MKGPAPILCLCLGFANREQLERAEARASRSSDKLVKDLEEARREVAELRARVDSLEAELEAAHRTIRDLRRQLEEALARIKELEALLQSKTASLESRETEAREAQQHALLLQDQMIAMAEASNKLEVQMSKLGDYIDTLEKRLEEKERLENDLQKQVEHCVAELEQRDAALSKGAETNVKLKASEGTALSELAEARRRLQVGFAGSCCIGLVKADSTLADFARPRRTPMISCMSLETPTTATPSRPTRRTTRWSKTPTRS